MRGECSEGDNQAENQWLDIAFKSLTFSGESSEKLIYHLWFATGAIAGLMFTQVATLRTFFSLCGIFWSFLALFVSAVLGLVAWYCAFLRKTLCITYSVCEAEKDSLLPMTEFELNHFTNKYFSALPCVARPGLWFLLHRKHTEQRFFEQSAYWTVWQQFLLFLQEMFLILFALPLMCSFKYCRVF